MGLTVIEGQAIKLKKHIILKWVNSCETSEQLDLISKPVEKFWLRPFCTYIKRPTLISILFGYQIAQDDSAPYISIYREIADAIAARRLVVFNSRSHSGASILDAYSPQLKDIID